MEISLRYWDRELHARDPEQAKKIQKNVTPSGRQSILPSGLGKSVSLFTGARLAYFSLNPTVGQVASLQRFSNNEEQRKL